jgi:2,3-bisphosphoglycerate-dependent phosphoglycerate mutase
VILDLYLVRHGQPTVLGGANYNVLPGPSLSTRGRNEAAAAAAFLAGKGIEQIFASPFDRAAQTAAVLGEHLGLPVSHAKEIAEMGPGETFAIVRARVAEFVDGLEDSPYQRVVIVTHGSPIKELLMHLSRERIDLSKHSYTGGNPAPTCGIWHIRRGETTRTFTLAFKPEP